MNNKIHECTRMLRVVYTDAERLELGKQLADEHADLRGVNSDFDRVKAEFKSKITSHEAVIEDLSNKVSTGYRMETVKCNWVFDLPNPGMKTLIRSDTHEEIETTDMSEADKQAELELADAERDPSEKVKEIAAEILSAPPAVQAAAKNLVANLRKSGTTMTVESGGKSVTVK